MPWKSESTKSRHQWQAFDEREFRWRDDGRRVGGAAIDSLRPFCLSRYQQHGTIEIDRRKGGWKERDGRLGGKRQEMAGRKVFRSVALARATAILWALSQTPQIFISWPSLISLFRGVSRSVTPSRHSLPTRGQGWRETRDEHYDVSV
jgi:hypothetical protein